VSTPGVVFDRVWKKFSRGQRFNSLRDLIPEMASLLFRGRDDSPLEAKQFWALQDVSFEVQPGQALGIIGPNGAGKSTALKTLTKILRPDRGRASVTGRVGALVEIAAGFHPDLTGRENVFMQGAIMGMKRAEILRKFDAIVEFAGVGDFVDTPVGRYSSGMNARLGFAVAAHLDPDVLLIDEVLSVGDLSYQEKCFDRMQQFVQSGIPVVFVSHNLAAVSQLCDRVLVLRAGRVEALAPTQEAIALYAKIVQDSTPQHDRHEVTLAVQRPDATPVSEISAGEPIAVKVAARPRVVEARLGAELRIQHLQSGAIVYRAHSGALGAAPIDVSPGGTLEITWSMTANLARGHYGIWCQIMNERGRGIARSSPVIVSVTEEQSYRAIVFLDARCEMRSLGPARVAVEAFSA
jgi:lipopolysaccharide transport system ATP-binding protein